MLDRLKVTRNRRMDHCRSFMACYYNLSDNRNAGHNFHGCIPGIHEILRRQGLLEGRWCLNPSEKLSPGQMEEIDRVYDSYPHLNDDDFVEEFLSD